MLSQISGKEYPRLLQRYDSLSAAQLDKVENLADEYLSGTIKSSALPLLGGIGLGLYIGAISSIPAIGAIAGSGLIYGAISTALKKGRNAEYLKNAGILAPFLSEADLVTYYDLVGREAITAEIQQAYSDRQSISTAARRFMAQIGQPLKPRTIANHIPTEAEFAAAAVEEFAAAVAVGDGAAAAWDIATHFLQNLRCTFLCAPPRTGKGIAAAGMMLAFKTQYPKGWLGSCTIKQFAGENWYWQASDKHINPTTESGTDLAAAARAIYQLYQTWASTPSTEENPSLLVIDELRDTLLRLKGLKMGEVTPDYPLEDKPFCDWLRGELVSAATMNQCHSRYVLLMAPVNGAKALTFPDANSLQAYAAYILATPSELSFTGGGNSVFAAPAIETDDPRWKDWYGLAYSTKGGTWVGIPTIPAAQLAKLQAASAPVSSGYQVVNAAHPSELVEVGPPPLPEAWELIGRSMLATTFATDIPGTITADGKKVPMTSDPIEAALLNYLANRPGQKKATRDFLSAKLKPLEGMKSDEIRDYLECLAHEGKIEKSGASFVFAG